MNPIQFTKMHGAGNDFIVIDCIHQKFLPNPEVISKMASRNFGIGADQVLLVEPSNNPNVDFRYRIFNANGTEVEQCGNGARCFMVFVLEQGLTDKNIIRVGTTNGIIQLERDKYGFVEVDMGYPSWNPDVIPFDNKKLTSYCDGKDTLWPVVVKDREISLSILSLGNPHAVKIVDNVATEPVAEEGPLIEKNPLFPKGINIEYMQCINRSHVRLRVWERGVGETLACGTGACAGVVSGIMRGLLDSKVKVEMQGGTLTVQWEVLSSLQEESNDCLVTKEGLDNIIATPCNRGPVLLSGPAIKVFEGKINIEDLLAS